MEVDEGFGKKSKGVDVNVWHSFVAVCDISFVSIYGLKITCKKIEKTDFCKLYFKVFQLKFLNKQF